MNQIEEKLLEWLQARSKASISRKSKRVNPSDVANCHRQLGYKVLTDVPREPFGPYQIVSFDDGNEWEERLISYYLAEALLETQYRVVDRQRIITIGSLRGKIDGIVVDWDDPTSNNQTLLEVKTTKEYKGADRYYAQATLYMGALGVNSTLFSIKSKSTGVTHWDTYQFEQGLYNSLVDKVNKVMSAKDPYELPRDFAPNKKGWLPFDCNYCPYVLYCWKDDNVRRVKDRPVLHLVNMPTVSR